MFTEDELHAQNWRTLKKFVGYEFQQLGGGLVWKFYPGEERPRQRTKLQKILDFAVVSNVLGRSLKVTSYGHTERLRRAQSLKTLILPQGMGETFRVLVLEKGPQSGNDAATFTQAL